MTRIKRLLAATTVTVLLMLATPAFAQYKPWPTPFPAAPAWGDYDAGHVWHDAAWWWDSQLDWVKQHHPEWWGDFDDDHLWHPAGWWWQFRRDWVQQNHPDWARENHPNWWGDFDDKHAWHADSWWHDHDAAWANHIIPNGRATTTTSTSGTTSTGGRRKTPLGHCSIIPSGTTRSAGR
jgi:hypothetical protein